MKTILRPKTGSSISKLLAVALLVLLSSSCNDFFVKEDFTLVEIQNADDLNVAVLGVKDLLAHQIVNQVGIGAATWGPERYGDDLCDGGYHHYYDKRNFVSNVHFGLSSIEINEYHWKGYYQIIVSANNVIKQFENGQLDFDGAEQSVGEILFIRAFAYYRLVRFFGEVPIVSDIDINEKLPKASYNEIYSFIESDLLRASGYVVKQKTINETLTIDKACVKGLLAEVYLSWAGYPAKETSKYAEAAKTAKGLLDSAAYYHLAFTEQFDQLWVNGLVNTSEDVFCFYINNFPMCKEFLTPYSRYKTEGNIDIFCTEGKVRYKMRSGSIAYYAAEGNFYNRFPPGYRKDQTFFTTIYVPELTTEEKEEYYKKYWHYLERDTGLFYIAHVENDARPIYRKFFSDTTNHTMAYSGEVYWSPKINLLRLTHTVLTYTEAQARTGQVTPEAYEWINKIRRRANNVPVNSVSKYDLPAGLSPEAFADSVVLERAWELAGEPEGRWFDLLRLEKIEEMMNSKMDVDIDLDDDIMQPNSRGEYFYEIPEYDKLINENLK